jgi:hypothetical protein
MEYNIGDTVNYKTLDMEYYSRGYGIAYERGTAKIKSIQYRLENRMTISEKEIQERKGDIITYRTLDMEYYGRGYGIAYETGTSKIEKLQYSLENGLTITQEDILPS